MEKQNVPNESLYISNLPDKVNKDELKKLLYLLFTQHGRVIEIVVKKSADMRGQAHVIFQDIPDATSAMRALQSFPFYDKPIKIQFAKQKSSATKRLELKLQEFYRLRRPRAVQEQEEAKAKAVALAEKEKSEALDKQKKAKKVVEEEEEEEDNMEIE